MNSTFFEKISLLCFGAATFEKKIKNSLNFAFEAKDATSFPKSRTFFSILERTVQLKHSPDKSQSLKVHPTSSIIIDVYDIESKRICQKT